MFVIAASIYLIVLISYVVLKKPVGERILFTTLMSYVYHWALLPVFVILALALVQKEWFLAGLAWVNIIAGLYHFRPYLPDLSRISQASTTTSNAIPLSFFTYNLGNSKTRPAALVQAIRDVDADVVALQELTIEQADQLEDQLAFEYPYQLLKGLGIPGIGLLSKYPFESADYFYLVSENPYQYVVLDINGYRMAVVNAHPPPQLTEYRTKAYGWGSEDIPHLVEELDVQQMPHVLLGDFNVTDQSQDYQQIMRMGLRDAYHEQGNGFGFTFPAQPGTTLFLLPPIYRIDYVFHTEQFETVDAFIGPNAGSDHQSLVAHLVWYPVQEQQESSSKFMPELNEVYEVEVAAFATK